MKKSLGKNAVVLVTGASSGIGRACAETFMENGFTKVYGTSRKSNHDLPWSMLQMDLVDESSVEQAIQHLLEKEGRIDILINNSGIGIAGFLEDCSIQDARDQFEVNFFGLIKVCQLVLPSMRRHREGIIINISSLGGLFGLPIQGLYSASKFAVEGYTESLRMELLNSGVKAVLVAPGDIQTNFTSNRRKVMPSRDDKQRYEAFQKAMSTIEKDEAEGIGPKKVAQLIYRIAEMKDPKVRYLVGGISQTIVPFLKTILPSKLFVRLLGGHYGI